MPESETNVVEIRKQSGTPRPKAPRKRRDGDGPGGSPLDGLPIIKVNPGELPRAVDEAEAALIAAGKPVFARAGRLVRPVVEEVGASDERVTMTARLGELGVDAISELLAQVARFQQWSERKARYVDIDPPEKVARALLAREGEWGLRRVSGVITTPTLRRDGTLLSKFGHDERTGLYLAADPSFRMPAIPDAPTRTQARAAAQVLEDLLTNFPFVAPVDRAVALSGILTAVVRGTMPAAPLHAIRASTPASGKSYMADIISAIATGRICPAIAPGKTEEEMEKRLGARLLHAVPLMSIDNVNGELGGVFLCQVTERPIVSIRILGRSEMRDVECRTLVLATGNNLTLVGDMTRRTVLCTLDAELERPETRVFDFSPVDRVLQDRGAYIAAALTIIRAYRTAGFPDARPPLASYKEWSLTVRSALVWLGYSDPVESMETAREEDPELSAMRELFGHWEARLGLNSGYTSAAVVQAACALAPVGPGDEVGGFADPEFRDLLLRQAGERGQINTRRLGKWFSKITGRIVEGRRLTVAPDESHGNRYSLQEGPQRSRPNELRSTSQPHYQPSA
jgi:putative DNA primase/helicase